MWSGWTLLERMDRKISYALSRRPPATNAVMSAEYVITLGMQPLSVRAAFCMWKNTCTHADILLSNCSRLYSCRNITQTVQRVIYVRLYLCGRSLCCIIDMHMCATALLM